MTTTWIPEFTSLKIYTKTGDTGHTGLLGGVRVSKSHLAVEVVGALDETNSIIGMAISQSPAFELVPHLTQIQNDLFDLGSCVAACESETARTAVFLGQRAVQLELWIDQYQAALPPLKEFILPGGSPGGATLHYGRTVCRRCERSMVVLIESGARRNLAVELVYLNRLSDLLFVFARFANEQARSPETTWTVTR